ncbi:hypothetical protein N658DRAFT_234658 [Parathielavia hyrcaniae]|uniref:Uncharacterized protein n=1 Tax=Parathielavia hyrcaniae TaxID=113614 RepID=A0AAN6Q801_9PEZI|nr:hypothetical protein N658DRAFT_234658 [Parathielavia hyrcaniae]
MRKALGCAALSCALGLAGAKAVKWLDNSPRWEPAAQTAQLDYQPDMGRVAAMATPAPKPPKARAVLEARDSTDNTCGYVDGEFTRSLWTTRSCFVPTVCYDLTDSASYTSDDGFTRWCGDEEYPYCKKYTYEDDVFTGYTLYGCGVAAGTLPIYYEPFDGPTITGSTRSPTTRSRTTTTDSTSTTSTTSSDSSSDSTSASSSSSSSSTSTATPIPDPAPASGPPTDPIVGGVVGGVGAIALIILGIWALMRQKDKKKKAADAAAAGAAGAGAGAAHYQQQQQQQHPSPGPPGPPNMAYAQPPPSEHGMTKIDPHQHGGYYNPSVVGGFDPRASMAPTTISPPQSPPPQHHGTPSPPPQFAQQQQQHQGGYAAYGNVSPNTAVDQQQQQQFGNSSPSGTTASGGMGFQPYHPGGVPQQQQQQQQQPQAGQQQGYASYAHELPAQRGDSELRELQG